MIKKLLFTLFFAFLFVQISNGQNGVEPTGSGSSEDPYLIETLENLIWVREQTNSSTTWSDNKYFEQTADIDLISISDWTPIGIGDPGTVSAQNGFQGTYDGKNFTLRNLRIDNSSSYRGLFGYAWGATIKNVRIENANVTAGSRSGILLGASNCFGCTTDDKTEIIQVSVQGNITAHNTSTHERIGGIVGNPGQSTEIKGQNVFIGNVTGRRDVGGLVGRASGDAELSFSYARANVTGTNVSNSTGVGILIGNTSTGAGVFEEMYAEGTATVSNGTQNKGAIGIAPNPSSGNHVVTDIWYDYSGELELIGNSGNPNPSWVNITGGGGLATSDMQGNSAEDNMEGTDGRWDFSSSGAWRTVSIPDDDYPVFAWQAGEVIEISGTVSAANLSGAEGIEVIAQVGDETFVDVTTTTDGSGDYSFDVFTVPTQRVFARTTDNDGLPIGAAVEGPFTTESTTIDLTLQPRYITISSGSNNGWVRDGNEIPVVEADAVLNVNTLRDELLAGDVTVVAGVDIIFDDNFEFALTASRALTLKAGRDIVVDDNIDIAPTGDSLNMVFWSDINGGEVGGVLFKAGSTIHSNNGHIWIGGGAGSSTWNNINVGDSYAVGLTNTASGTSETYAGINLVGNLINAGTGDIYLSGKSTQTTYRFGIGTRIFNMDLSGGNITIFGIGSANEDSHSGDNNRGNWGVGIEHTDILASGHVVINGTGGGQNLTSATTNGINNHGVRMNNTSSIIATGSDNITITGIGGTPAGTSNTDNDGLRIDGGTIRVNTGTLTLNGTAGSNSNSEDIDYTDGDVESKTPSDVISTGNIEILANTLNIASGVFRSEGDLRVEPRTASNTIGIAGATGTLALPANYFSTNFSSDFATVTIGSPDQTGLISINNFEAFNGLRLQSESVLAATGQTFTIPQGVAFSILDDTVFEVASSANLEVGSGGILTIEQDATLTNGGAVNVRSGAFFNNQSSSTPEVNFHRDLVGAEGWRYLTAPVSTTLKDLLDPIWTQGADNANTTSGTPNVYRWGDVEGRGRDKWMAVEDLNETIEAGKGFLVFVYADDNFDGTDDPFPKELSVSGPEFEVPTSVTTNSADTEGWSLLGNPFGTAISFNELQNGTGITGTVYVWSPDDTGETDETEFDSGSWKTFNTGGNGDLTDGLIAPFQAFFVQNDGDSGFNLSFTNAIKSTNISDTEFLFKQGPQQHIRLELTGNGMRNSAWLAFDNDGNPNQRTAGDAWQLEPMSADYTLLAAKKPGVGLMDIGHFPDSPELQIPLVATATRPGSYTLTLSDAAMSGLYLHDLHTGRSMPVEQGATYEFQINTAAKDPSDPFARLASPLVMQKTQDQARFVITTSAEITPNEEELPRDVRLAQNYPNPFNPSTTIAYELPQQADVRLQVFDMAGRQVAELVNGQVQAGRHNVQFDASSLASGVYMYRLQADSKMLTRKLTVIK